MNSNSPNRWFNLEEQFFAHMDQELMNKLRTQISLENSADEIAKVIGISDMSVAREIAELGVSVETLAAFRLAPLVAVAWADDRVEENERYMITRAAEQSGISSDDPAMKLLEAWTIQRPSGDLLDAWCDYSKSLCASLSEEHRNSLKEEIMSSVRSVSEACGGLLGFGSVSPGEKAIMDRVDAALS